MSFSPDNFDYRFMAEEIKSKGHEKVLDGLLKELDCSRYIENVGYPITYNCYAYDRTCWKFNYVLDDGIKKKESNADAKEPVRRTRKVRTKDMFSGKVSTETLSEDGKLRKTAADRRLEALNSRTINFAFGSFKPKKHE